jgi:hypothetical protein
MANKSIIKFRRAFKEFWVEKIKFKIDSGALDSDIKGFLNGDNLSFKFTIDTIPNDVIFMRALVGLKTSEHLRQKLHKKWKNEDKGFY